MEFIFTLIFIVTGYLAAGFFWGIYQDYVFRKEEKIRIQREFEIMNNIILKAPIVKSEKVSRR